MLCGESRLPTSYRCLQLRGLEILTFETLPFALPAKSASVVRVMASPSSEG